MNYIQKTYYFDYDNPVIKKIIKDVEHLTSPQDIIEQLYLKVRDGWRYLPFNIGLYPNPPLKQ